MKCAYLSDRMLAFRKIKAYLYRIKYVDVIVEKIDKNRMKITLIRQDNGSGKETLSICEAGTLFDKMKTETKAGHITALREIIPLLEGTYARYEFCCGIYPDQRG